MFFFHIEATSAKNYEKINKNKLFVALKETVFICAVFFFLSFFFRCQIDMLNYVL